MVICRLIEMETKFMNEGFIKTPIEPRKPDKKKYGKPKPRPKPAVKYYEAEAEAESIKNSM